VQAANHFQIRANAAKDGVNDTPVRGGVHHPSSHCLGQLDSATMQPVTELQVEKLREEAFFSEFALRTRLAIPSPD
jgi:hypothetical protein